MISSRSRKRKSKLFSAIAFALVILCALPQSAWAVPQISPVDLPSSAETGVSIPIRVNITSDLPIQTVWFNYENATTGAFGGIGAMVYNETSGLWSYDIPPQSWKSEMRCTIKVTDTHDTAQYSFTIVILGEEEPKVFPWSLVITIIFLGVVLVLTELAFKPGLYRKTGREKAKELEEEDRKRELESGEKQN